MKVPADLREHLKLKVEVRVSLGARDKAEAKKLNAERKAIQLREWKLLRQRIKNGPRRTTPGLAVEFAIFTGMEEVPVKSSPAKTGDTSVPLMRPSVLRAVPWTELPATWKNNLTILFSRYARDSYFSSVTFASTIIFPNLADSARINSRNCSGEVGDGSKPD